MATSQLESLPLEVLQRICEFLGDARHFALASRTCLYAAKAVIYSTIRIAHSSPESLRSDAQHWISRLDSAASFHHVRCLVLEQARQDGLNITGLHDPAAENLTVRWQYYFNAGNNDHHNDAIIADEETIDQQWRPVANLITQLPGLAELHYACKPEMAPCILESIESRTNCRLFLGAFNMRGLLPSPSDTIRPGPYTLKLAATPCLFSIMSTHAQNLDDQRLGNEIVEAALYLASGIAPQLKQVDLCDHVTSGPRYTRLRMQNPSIEWKGTKLGQKQAASAKGALNFLELRGNILCTVYNLCRWADATDFSKLVTLKLKYYVGADVLRWLARTNLASLKSLSLHVLWFQWYYHQDHFNREQEQAEVSRLLVAIFGQLNPLHTLQIAGDYTRATVRQIFNRHGKTLQKLAISTRLQSIFKDDDDRDDKASVQRTLPVLRELATPVYRTNGDLDEVRQYEWLGKNCPNLRRLSLLMDCKYVTSKLHNHERLPGGQDALNSRTDDKFAEMQYLLRNSAVDGMLAEAIFRRISSSKPVDSPPLEHLELHVNYANDSIDYPMGLRKLSIFLGLSWVCVPNPRDDRKDQVITERLHRFVAEDYLNHSKISEGAMRVFYSVWPQQSGKPWQDTWHSFPLVE